MTTLVQAALFVAALTSTQPATQPSASSARGAAPDSAAVTATVEAFHAALAAGDSAAAMALLAPDVVVQEAGDVETREEYAAHHVGADIEFERAVPGERKVGRVFQRGDVAWITATSVTRGTFRGRAIASQGAELMILSRSDVGWRIRAIHWSSHRL